MATNGRDALWASGHDESVEVNQRALIDKVLARYSGEFTVFRELLQNSDDAQSKAVEIHFETQRHVDLRNGKAQTGAEDSNSVPDLKTTPVHQWTFKNNGIIFRDEDWNRLKKIAEGNPDEEKIGAFGVGFYSLFSVTEEPFVTSGGQWMGFYWKDKKDQLFARRGNLSNSTWSPWTTFEMALRDPTPIPEVSVFLDNKCLAKLTKTAGVSKPIDIPKGLKGLSHLGIMNVASVKTTPLHIKAEVMRLVYSTGSEKPSPPMVNKQTKPTSRNAFFSSIFANFSPVGTPQRMLTPLPKAEVEVESPLTVYETNVTLSIFSADVDVRLEQRLATELHRATKKNPPSKIKYELIYTAKDGYDASTQEDAKQSFVTGSIFQGLRADLDGSGSARIFIGHATGQTTGLGGHMAARFIPTVERESVDLVDRNVAVWNRELLYVGGFLARVAYDLELDAIRNLWNEASIGIHGPPAELQEWFTRRALHALKFFTFHVSTPSFDVSSLMEATFFSCRADRSFSIISTVGIRDASVVRFPDPVFTTFLKQLPVLPEEVSIGAPSMVSALQSRGMIKAITFADVLDELRSRPLAEKEMIACLKWWINLQDQGSNTNLPAIRTELLNAAVLSTGELGTPDEKIIPLSSIQKFVNPRSAFVHLGGPMPEHVIPQSVTQFFTLESLAQSFPWTELSIVDWLRHLTTPAVVANDIEHDINRSESWAEHVLSTLSRSWPSLSNGVKEQVIALLKDQTCIPTTAGLKMPEQAYFANANVFKDLPIVKLPLRDVKETFLQALGLRKHVDLQLVFNRMIKSGDWTIYDLIKYLVAVRSTLNDEEMQRLRMTPAFSFENAPSDPAQQKASRRKAMDLYEPLDVFRQLKLPVIDWGNNKWSPRNEDAKFLFNLGLQRFPPLEVIIGLCASADPVIRPIALKYFLDNVSTRYPQYDPANFAEVSFVPSTTRLGTPGEVFTNSNWASFGFLVVHPSIQPQDFVKLRLREHPPASLLVDRLCESPPINQAEATKLFGILAGRISDFSTIQLSQLSALPIVPIQGSYGPSGTIDDSTSKWLPPSQCFFGNESRAQFHSKLFVFVDFGPLANSFLSACGAKNQPSVEEVVQILLADPRKFYDLAGGRDNFLAELRNLAVNSRLLSSATMTRLRKAPVLLGMQRKHRNKSGSSDRNRLSSDDDDEDDWEMQYDLKKPDQIIIADDIIMYQVFGDSVFTAPQEDILEGFYQQLGSKRISSLVKEEYKTSAEIQDSRIATEVRSLILERLPLFLHEHTHARTRISFTWLNTGNNFVVKTYGKLSVTKTLNFGDIRLSRTQDASAIAKRIGFGSIQLWLAGNAQLDMYEVATALCRLIFDSPKAHDTLLLMTILSTDLRSLKRRGYNVDRILRQQKAERRAAEESARLSEENTALLPSTSRNEEISTTNAEKESTHSRPSSILMQNIRRKFTSTIHHNPSSSQDVKNIPDLPRPPRTGSRPQGHLITPLSNISSNIDQAIKACSPETKHLLRNREQMHLVKESLEEGYCDISGRAGDLTLIGTMGGVKIYSSQEVPNPQSILTTKRDVLARFIHVIQPLAQVYTLPLTTLHIFYDLKGDLIAFNRNASIFLNLRYFEAWHDEDVRSGSLASAYTSWFFTLAHEIAHNLVQPHNSEHEFYFSALCEKYVGAFGKLL